MWTTVLYGRYDDLVNRFKDIWNLENCRIIAANTSWVFTV